MKTFPEACTKALAAIEADPLNLPEDVLEHVHTCPTCAETRVLWLAQEPFPAAIPPAGYFEALPGRLLQKLPPPRRKHAMFHRQTLWAAAAILAIAAGIGGFMAGRVNRTPVLEASMLNAPTTETVDATPDTPFRDGDEELNQLMNLTPEETKVLLEHLKSTSKSK
jgi:hypothetical protein